MSAFVFIDNVVTGGRTARGARAWLLALLTLLGTGAALRAGGQQHRFDDGVEGHVGAHDREVRAEERPRQSARGIRHRDAAADRPRFPRYRQRSRHDPAHGRGCRAPQRQRDPGRQPDARRLQPQPAPDIRNAGRRQRRAGDAHRPERPARRQAADGAAVRGVAYRRHAARAARRRFPPGHERRGPDRHRPVRSRHRDRHPAAGQGADRRLHQDVAAEESRAPARRAGFRHAHRHRRHVHAGRRTRG